MTQTLSIPEASHANPKIPQIWSPKKNGSLEPCAKTKPRVKFSPLTPKKGFSGYRKISESILPKLEQSKSSTTNFKIIRAYAVNTSRGIIRNYNEDRVAIILNIMKPDDKDCKYWPNCSFFGVNFCSLSNRYTMVMVVLPVLIF